MIVLVQYLGNIWELKEIVVYDIARYLESVVSFVSILEPLKLLFINNYNLNVYLKPSHLRLYRSMFG